MKYSSFLIILGLLAVLLSTPAAQARPALQAAPPTSDFGINSNIASRHPNYEGLYAPADLIAGMGVGWVREDFQFYRLQPDAKTFDWGQYDRMVELFTARGIKIIGLLNGPTPGWASGRGGPSFFPPDPQKYAAFAQAVVARYKDRIHHWQIWNEPGNVAYWQPQPDIGAYITLLKAAAPAIKAADPTAQVLVASEVSPQPAADFLRQIHAAGAWNLFDIIALNPYTDPYSPEDGQIDVAGIGAVRGLADTLGSKPIWATEYGWSTGPADRTRNLSVPIDEETQGHYLIRGAVLLRAAGAEHVIWYHFKDTENVGGVPHNLYGLVRYDPTRASYDPSLHKSALWSFKIMAQQLAGTTSATLLDLSKPISVLDFERFGTWRRGDEPNGTFVQSREQVHSGKAAVRLDYTFPGAENDYVVFKAANSPALPANTSKLGIWLYGDGSAHALKVWLRDKQGEVLQFRLGPVGGPGWHYVAAPLGGQVDPGNVIGTKRNLKLDFPVSLVAFVLDDDPDSVSGKGTLYLDDLTAIAGPASYAVRFTRGDELIDVVWAPRVTQVAVPTQSSQITRVRAWGETTVEPSHNGLFTFIVGPDPVYLHHLPPQPE
jgi:hypothetical protein